MKIFLRNLFILLVVAGLIFVVAFTMLPLPGSVPILMYHFVGAEEDAAQSKNLVSEKSLARHMAFLKRFGYRVISLDELYEMKQGNREPQGREIAITFDDGNYTFETLAFPVLKTYEYPVTVFIISGNIRNEIHGSMTEETIRQLAKNDWITFGSHSRMHPFLTELDEARRANEILGSKKILEGMFDVPFHYFSYPYGDLNQEVIETVEEAGYRLAFTTSMTKLKGLEEGPYSLTRVKITRSSDNLLSYWVKVSGLYQFFRRFRYQLKN